MLSRAVVYGLFEPVQIPPSTANASDPKAWGSEAVYRVPGGSVDALLPADCQHEVRGRPCAAERLARTRRVLRAGCPRSWLVT